MKILCNAVLIAASTPLLLLPLSTVARGQQSLPSTAKPKKLSDTLLSRNRLPIDPSLIEAIEKAHAADLRGEELTKAGAYTDAIGAFQEALSYEPHDGLAYQHLAETYTAMNQPDKAIAAYRTLFYEWPGKGGEYGIGSNTTVLMQFALVLLKTGQKAEALTVYQRGYHFLPTDRGPLPPLFTTPDFAPANFTAAAYTAMGLHETAWGIAADAPAYFERAIATQPTLAVPYYYYGELLKGKPGRAADAVAAFNQARQLGGPQMQPFIDKAAKQGTTEFEAAEGNGKSHTVNTGQSINSRLSTCREATVSC